MKITMVLEQNTFCLVGLAGLALWFAPLARPQSFSDGFEGNLSNWIYTGPGPAAPTSVYARTGSESVQLSTVSTFPWSASLAHSFGTDQSGAVSIYVHSALTYAAAGLELDQNNGGWVNIQETGSTGSYQTRVCSSPSSSDPLCSNGLFFSGSNDVFWHKFEIDTGTNGVTVKLDGITIVTDPSITTFRIISFAAWGAPSAGSAFFDDFSFIAAHLYHVCLLYDPAKAVKAGATIPIKLDLCDGCGNDLSSSDITVHAINISHISDSISGAVEDSGDSNPDNDFRFDATLGNTGGYIFNLKTTGLIQGTYSINFTVGVDSFVYAAQFQVK